MDFVLGDRGQAIVKQSGDLGLADLKFVPGRTGFAPERTEPRPGRTVVVRPVPKPRPGRGRPGPGQPSKEGG